MDDLQRLFLDVVDLESGQRSQYFEKHGIASELRTQVESLLRFDLDSERQIEGVIADTVEHFLDSAPERFCGPYELVRLLGRGGMGSVYLAQRKDGEVDLDFNKAYNPPCAFTPYATCPLPPKENRLAVRIEAGELKYGSH